MAMNVPSDSLVRSGQPLSLTSQVKHGEKENYNPEFWYKKFRDYKPLEGSDPIQNLRKISDLCHQWLRPDLNSKEEILDQLVLEQFLNCMPSKFETLVKESGVKSCKDLEEMLRERRSHKSSIIDYQGQACLLRDPSVGKDEAPEETWDPIDLSQEHLSSRTTESLNRGQASLKQQSPELQNLSEMEEPSTSQSGKKFAHWSTLQGHRRVHTDERPYMCQICGERFGHKGSLTVHFRIHLDDVKPYSCKKCDKHFRQQGTLKRHMKTHNRNGSG
ncbi:zinc finger and SCAN domain-containing protein 5B-like [Grammomys surdaster]|uniref:zinc finger and SCAN domain-containing protein 5B-like n=1 Tax=Grammomys surdaster TaxID=491861 RepID=UPI00109FE74B|nr:zinc finger and SCAN domain-containing protein 5B-like [Grammomys surdaster]